MMLYNPILDRAISWFRFVKKHRRFPSDELLFNDVLYKTKTSNEILKPQRVFVTDKEFVKLFVAGVVGEQYNVPTLGVVRSAAEVQGYSFPDDCCIKPTHASGAVIIRRNGERIDIPKIEKWFDYNHYYVGRERNYRQLTPKVIIEPIIDVDDDLKDYKVFCYNGIPRIIQLDTGVLNTTKRKLYDTQWRDLGYTVRFEKSDETHPAPQNVDEMLEVSRKLAARFDGIIRVDLYSVGKKIYVGELTNVSGNAHGVFKPRTAEKEFSDLLFS